MTFVVDKDGVFYQKDLGEKTVELAQGMAQYDPGDDWKSAISPSTKRKRASGGGIRGVANQSVSETF